MQLTLQAGPIHVVAAKDQRVDLLALRGIPQELSQIAKVAPNLVVLVALRMAGIITGVAIATSMSRHGIGDGHLLPQLSEFNRQDPRVVAVGERDPEPWILGKQGGERFQMKPAVHEQARRERNWRQIKFPPDVLT